MATSVTPGAAPTTSRADQSVSTAAAAGGGTVMTVLLAISFSHFLNDTLQSLIPSIYPMLKDSFGLDFGQIGLITLTFQMTASLLQPLVGVYTDKKPQPYSLAFGMGLSLLGLVLLSVAWSFPLLLAAAALVGMGSSIFHPESSRVARMASGRQPGLAQSIFQVGGNAGSAVGPLLAAFIVLERGQGSIAWFSFVALLAIFVLWNVGRWYARNRPVPTAARSRVSVAGRELAHGRIVLSLVVLCLLVFSKFFYMASMTSYYTFYLISTFGVSVQSSQILLFVFLFAVAAGVIVGGPVGDRLGRKWVIWASILGVLPFTLALPYVSLFWTVVLSVVIGAILASAFPSIIVYAQDLLPGKIGMISGLFFGLAFGMGGVGAAVLGELADWTSIGFVYKVCSFLPAIGLLTAFLPDLGHPSRPAARAAA